MLLFRTVGIKTRYINFLRHLGDYSGQHQDVYLRFSSKVVALHFSKQTLQNHVNLASVAGILSVQCLPVDKFELGPIAYNIIRTLSRVTDSNVRIIQAKGLKLYC